MANSKQLKPQIIIAILLQKNPHSNNDTQSNTSHSSTFIAHPPSTANMSNMVIDAPSDTSASSIKISTKQ